MTLRNTSGKFSLPSFGRKSSGVQDPDSPIRANGNYHDDPNSPTHGSGFGHSNGGGSGSGNAFDGFGRKLGKSIAHQSLLPALGNRDLRALQDIISSEKGVLQATEKLGAETQKAAGALPAFGAQEGPDLQDVLTHSSTLLNQLGTALNVFVDHSANLRGCFKRIREREEELDELRRRRRATGSKAETAEKKLAKMGPENKSLPSQTELLERLRGEMRQMDTEIISEESKIGDFKRQQIKEALSYKFGGLEELGEKMCIIGELGKLLLEEIPLEETPPGYGRAPYLGYSKTESAVNEATKCLATVKFAAGSANPKPPGLPPHNPSERLTTPQLPNSQHVSAAEEFAHYPGGTDATSPAATKGKARDYGLDESNPYGGVAYGQGQSHLYDDFGGTRGNGNDHHVVFQGPTDDAIHGAYGQNGEGGEYDYEYEQQQQLNAEERAWKETPSHLPQSHDSTALAPPPPIGEHSAAVSGSEDANGLNAPWQPLNVKRDRAATPVSLHDGAVPRLDAPDLGERITTQQSEEFHPPGHLDLPPPPAIGSFSNNGPGTPSEREGFYTPTEGLTPEPIFPAQVPAPPAPPPPPPAPIPVPSPALPPTAAQSYTSAPGSGKISAAAFRRGAKHRGSTDPEETASNYGQSPVSATGGPRRLPLPPGAGGFGGPETPGEGGFEIPANAAAYQEKSVGDDAYADASGQENPPPQYHAENGGGESLR